MWLIKLKKIYNFIGYCCSLLLLLILRLYQLFISPFLAKSCIFFPSCSVYSSKVIKSHGVIRGIVLTLWRLVRCNPFNSCQIDHPPKP